MATLKDVAKKAGLSVTQVSRALNNHSDVNAQTRERIQAVARSLNYQPNMSARKLVSGRSGMVGVVVPQSPDLASDGLFIEVITGLSTYFSARSMQLVVHIAPKGTDILSVYRKLIGNGALDGFVLINTVTDDERVKLLMDLGMPFVVHGRIDDDPKYSFFDIDNEGIFRDLTQYLLSLGHQKIALLNGSGGRGYSEARLRGYQQALIGAGLVPTSSLVRNDEMTVAFGLVSTIDLFRDSHHAPTAIICGSARIAKGAYQALDALKLSVPDDVSVVAHDDHLTNLQTAAFYPALTVADAPLRDSWEPLAECLVEVIAGAPLSQTQRIGTHQMIIRQSTSKLKN